MAGALIIRTGVGFSCATRAYEPLVEAIQQNPWSERFEGLFDHALEIGAVSVADRSTEEAQVFLSIVEDAAQQISSMPEPPDDWPYPATEWRAVRDLMPALQEFVAEARERLADEARS